ncbi:uncharacterized protein LOC111518607 isoform X2 [Drosophila willistoni]|nr:uncharacterized protein LOC111518607 isoform X2 [Drosophila willistoni]
MEYKDEIHAEAETVSSIDIKVEFSCAAQSEEVQRSPLLDHEIKQEDELIINDDEVWQITSDGNRLNIEEPNGPLTSKTNLVTSPSKACKGPQDTESADNNQCTFYECVFTRLYVLDLWRTEKGTESEKAKTVIEVLREKIESHGYNPELNELEKRLNYVCKQIVTIWRKYKRHRSHIIQKKSKWFNQKERICAYKMSQVPPTNNNNNNKLEIEFIECSEKIRQARLNDDFIASALRSGNSKSISMPSGINPNEVLPLLDEAKLSEYQYLLIRSFINSKTSCNLLPSYEKLLTAKALNISKSAANVEAQN